MAEIAEKKNRHWKAKLLKWGIILFVAGLAINTIFVAAHVGGLLREVARLVTLVGLLAIVVRICLTWWGIVLVAIFLGSFAWFMKDSYRIMLGNRHPSVPLSQSVKDLIREGALFSKQGKFDEGIAKFNEALKIDPNYSELYFFIGVAESQRGNKDKALEYYGRAIEKDPRHFFAYKQSALIFSERKMDDQAHKYFINALIANPKDAETMYYLGLIEAMHNRFDAADRWFRKAEKAGYNIPEKNRKLVDDGLKGMAKVVAGSSPSMTDAAQKLNGMLAQIPPEAIEPYLKERDPDEKLTPVPTLSASQRNWNAIKVGMSGVQVMGYLGNPDLVRKAYADNATQVQFFYGNGIVTLVNDQVTVWQKEA